jgi:hypothetical protein
MPHDQEKALPHLICEQGQLLDVKLPGKEIDKVIVANAEASFKQITATPFFLRSEKEIPPREFLYGRHLIRGFVSLTIAPGGVGKTALSVLDAIAMASGRELVKMKVYGGPKRVWLLNLEDPQAELERRITATCKLYSINATDLGDRLFVDSGRDQPLCLAETTKNMTTIVTPVSDQLIAQIRTKHIDTMTVDPFVSSHAVSENDNGAIDKVAKEWCRIAHEGNCAIELVHHSKKLGDKEVNADASRGASSLVAAARSVRVLNQMTKAQAVEADEQTHRGIFSVIDDKNNLASPASGQCWYKMQSVQLENGDNVGVVTKWHWPDAMAGITDLTLMEVQEAIDGKAMRENCQAKDWVGITIAKVLSLDLTNKNDKAKVKRLVKTWISKGALVVTGSMDTHGKLRPTIEVGKRVKPQSPPPCEVGGD